jgi:protoporphyrinogen oxidase
MVHEPLRVPVLIVGGGLTGISTALHLESRYLLCERSRTLGGLARTVERDGFHFDHTGHWLHLRDPDITRFVQDVMGNDLVRVQRRARIFKDGVLTPYPFQANLHGHSPRVVFECLLAFVRARMDRGAAEPRNFEEYIRYHFGQGIADHFMIPYNEKLWGVHPREITSAWCARFVPIPDLEQVVAGAVGHGPPELGYNISFLYPRWGGIGSLAAALADRVPPDAVRVGVELESVDPKKRVAVVGGETVRYEALVSSIPLPELVQRLADPPDEVVDAAALLRATAVRYLSVAARTTPPEDYHWIYVPEKRLPFYRVGVYSNAMPSMAPPGCSSLYVELASRDRGRPREEVLAEAIPALVEARALRAAEDVVFAELSQIDHAYVVFDDNYERALERIHPYLERHGIHSRGRYGSWVYNAMEDSLIAGREVAHTVDRLLASSVDVDKP